MIAGDSRPHGGPIVEKQRWGADRQWGAVPDGCQSFDTLPKDPDAGAACFYPLRRLVAERSRRSRGRFRLHSLRNKTSTTVDASTTPGT